MRKPGKHLEMVLLCTFSAVLTAGHAGCTPNAGGVPGAGGNGLDGSAGGGGNTGGASNGASGTWNSSTGLELQTGSLKLVVPKNANPSTSTLTVRAITEEELRAGGLPAGSGFDSGVLLGPSGTTFAEPVQVTVPLPVDAALDSLPVLVFDEAARVWGDAGVTATVSSDHLSATFAVTHFSSYGVWNPPPPSSTVPIGGGDIVAGSGFFEGQPFNTLPNPTGTSASLLYSPFGDVFALSLINVDVENPATGDNVTLTAGLNSSEIRDLDGVKVGLVTPAGNFSGPSLFSDGTPAFEKPVSGVMYLRKTGTQWIVDVYCVYEGGVIFGQATGDL